MARPYRPGPRLPEYEPGPAEIAAWTAFFRASWDAATERSRRVDWREEWMTVPVVSLGRMSGYRRWLGPMNRPHWEEADES